MVNLNFGLDAIRDTLIPASNIVTKMDTSIDMELLSSD